MANTCSWLCDTKLQKNVSLYGGVWLAILGPCLHLVLKCILSHRTNVNDHQDTVAQTTCRGDLGCMWPHIFCNINAKASWWVPNKDIIGKYVTDAGYAGCFGDSTPTLEKKWWGALMYGVGKQENMKRKLCCRFNLFNRTMRKDIWPSCRSDVSSKEI